jgi:hypothetical protein
MRADAAATTSIDNKITRKAIGFILGHTLIRFLAQIKGKSSPHSLGTQRGVASGWPKNGSGAELTIQRISEYFTAMPTLAQLKQAVAIAEQIEKLQGELASIVGGSVFAVVAANVMAASAVKTGKRTMSPETIAKMRAAQQARWSKVNGPSAGPATAIALPSSVPETTKGKRVLSPEGRARIVAALKARHAAAKKAKS